MLANLLNIAGVNHVITIDLHASQMQGFFKCPVDNLHAEPIIARWIKRNVPGWREAVCVSKNAGGTKRVTSLADALKLNFGMVTTDKRRVGSNMSASMIMRRLDWDENSDVSKLHIGPEEKAMTERRQSKAQLSNLQTAVEPRAEPTQVNGTSSSRAAGHSRQESSGSQRRSQILQSPLRTATTPVESEFTSSPLARAQAAPPRSTPVEEEVEFTDERARDITHGRLVQGHIVPDDYPSPTQSAMSTSTVLENLDEDPMEMSRASSFFNPEAAPLGGSADAGESSDEEEVLNDPTLEQMITLVGDVKNRTVFLVDDMIDKSGSWIAAAECVVKRGGAKKVYIIATHGLFGGDSLEELQDCDCIDTILVTNSFPIPAEDARAARKLVVLDLSNLLAEAIRRNHYGESISPLFAHAGD
jgi:ribose-phosphate pyrophosphokinase